MTLELNHKNGKVTLEPVKGGKHIIRVFLKDPDQAEHKWLTSYPPELVRTILKGKGPRFLCDEIRRDEDPHYTAGLLEMSVSAYLPPKALDGKRILDFGCGSGASSMILARMFDKVDIVGVERSSTLLHIAQERARYYGLEHVEFLKSPADDILPQNLGRFDCLLLNAVFEHLLPKERLHLMPQLWELLRPGGLLLINETPDRRFPVETHTTGLPFINYFPDQMALAVARRLSPNVQAEESWQKLLRRGVRGGTPHEIMATLPQSPNKPVLMQPVQPGIRKAGQIWLEAAARRTLPFPKSMVAKGLLILSRHTGLSLSPYLCLAIKKGP